MGIIVGLNGDSGVGKSTVAGVFATHGFVVFSLSSVIVRRILADDTILDDLFADVNGSEGFREAYHEAKRVHGSELFIEWGQKMRAESGVDAISVAALPELENMVKSHGKVLIDDLRLGDDILKDHFRQQGCTFEMVHVSSERGVKKALDVGLTTDWTLDNDASVSRLERAVELLIEDVMGCE